MAAVRLVRRELRAEPDIELRSDVRTHERRCRLPDHRPDRTEQAMGLQCAGDSDDRHLGHFAAATAATDGESGQPHAADAQRDREGRSGSHGDKRHVEPVANELPLRLVPV